MKIIVLAENTAQKKEIKAEHGLSLYIETGKFKILFDMGQSNKFVENAEHMGIDLSQVDFAVLSHGHYDHGGGLKYFLEMNHKAPIYINKYAFEPHFNAENKDIGLDKALLSNGRLIFVEDKKEIVEDIVLYSCNDREKRVGMDCSGLKMVEGEKLVPEDFRHEQYLLICENDKKVLISGCSHKGILNIVEWFQPDVLVAGFHFMKMNIEGEDKKKLSEAAEKLMKYPTKYYTGHCTGLEQYEFMKRIMGSRLKYLSAGQNAEIKTLSKIAIIKKI
ncbi:MAG: MBL fold metallo-hydrolase [Schaedlerella sp.]|nr:MBL fold metallo-hydrolase [Schaedlerella sp.]